MDKYLDLVQNSLQQHLEELETSYQKDITLEMTEVESTIWDTHYDDAFFEAGRDFPQLLLLSFIIMWYSFVEQELIDFCENLKLSITIGPKDNEYLDKGIRRARKFLQKAKNYEIESDDWQELVNIGKLRNIIVHEGKHLSYDYDKPDGKCTCYINDEGLSIYIAVEEALFRYLHKHDMIEFSGPPFADIMPSFDYCKHLVKFGKEFFWKLHTDLLPDKHIFSPSRA